MSVFGILVLILLLVVATPLLVIVFSLLAMLIKLLKDNPKFAIIFAFVPMIIILLLFFRPAITPKPVTTYPISINQSSTERINRIEQIEMFERVFEKYMNPRVQNSSNISSPIWSEGIEEEFIADVYPSKESALRSIGLRIGEQLRHVMPDSESPDTMVIIQDSQNAELVEGLRDDILKRYPNIRCRIQTRDATIRSNEVQIRLNIINKDSVNRTILIERPPTRGDVGYVPKVQDFTYETGTIRAHISHNSMGSGVNVDYIEKNWVENLAYFLNSMPNLQLMVAKSSEGCLTQAEANQQAMEDVCMQVGSLIQIPVTMLSPNDILDNNMIVDRFVQSFEGSAGKIWREALLLDVSPEKLNRLADNIAYISRIRRFSFFETIASIAGLFLLICIVYAFLNAATKGYYTWSLRIVGVVLVLILIFLLLA